MGTFQDRYDQVSVIAFGAVGNGSGNQAPAIQAAVTSGFSTVTFPAGTFRVTDHIDVPPGVKLIGAGKGVTVIDGRAIPSSIKGVIDCVGSPFNLPGVAAMTRGDAFINFNTSVGNDLKKGDWIRVVDRTAFSWGADYNNYYDGFFANVIQVEGNNVDVAVDGGVRRTLPASRSGGPPSNIGVERLDARGLVIQDMAIWASGFDKLTGDTGQQSSVVQIQDVANIYIDRCDLLGGEIGGLRLQHCANVVLNGTTCNAHSGEWLGGSGYGLHIRSAAYVFTYGCNHTSYRHGVETNNFDGPFHAIYVNGGTITTPQTVDYQQPGSGFQTACNTHAGGYEFVVDGAFIYGGVDFRSGARLINCRVESHSDTATGCILITDMQQLMDVEIKGCDCLAHKAHFQSFGGTQVTFDTQALDNRSTYVRIVDNIWRHQVSSTRPLVGGRWNNSGPGTNVGSWIVAMNHAPDLASGSQALLGATGMDIQQFRCFGNTGPNGMTLGSFAGAVHQHLSQNVAGGTLL